MRVKVFVTPRQGILDPQGRAVEGSLKSLGFKGVGSVRVGRYIVVDIDAPSKAEAASGRETDVRSIARQSQYRGLSLRG